MSDLWNHMMMGTTELRMVSVPVRDPKETRTKKKMMAQPKHRMKEDTVNMKEVTKRTIRRMARERQSTTAKASADRPSCHHKLSNQFRTCKILAKL